MLITIVAGLAATALFGFCLRHFGVVSENSAWVSETKAVQIAKYILLALVLLAIGWFAYVSLQ
jgi:hypothetical protein